MGWFETPKREAFNPQALLFVGLFGVALVVMAVVFSWFHEDTPMGTLRGGSTFNVWLPEEEGFYPEGVVIGGGGASRAPYTVTRGPKASTFPVSPLGLQQTRVLTDEEWAALRQIRRGWCRQTPTFDPLPTGAPFYYVAFRCYDTATPKGTAQVKIPVGALPEALQAVIDSLPSVRVAKPK